MLGKGLPLFFCSLLFCSEVCNPCCSGSLTRNGTGANFTLTQLLCRITALTSVKISDSLNYITFPVLFTGVFCCILFVCCFILFSRCYFDLRQLVVSTILSFFLNNKSFPCICLSSPFKNHFSHVTVHATILMHIINGCLVWFHSIHS